MMKQTRVVKNPQDSSIHFATDTLKDFYFFPFYPAAGFTNRGEKSTIGERIYNSIINGETPVILKWLMSEGALEWVDKDNKKPPSEQPTFSDKTMMRTPRIGSYFVGFVTETDFGVEFANKTTGYEDTKGQLVNFTEQRINKVIQIIINEQDPTNTFKFLDENKVPDSNKIRLFFLCPELTGTDPLYITNYKPIFDKDQKYINTIITLTSLGEQLNGIGKQINTLINFTAPGESPLLPWVAKDIEVLKDGVWSRSTSIFYKKPEQNKVKEIPNTKRIFCSPLYNLQDLKVKYIQVDFFGLAGLSSLMLLGRKKHTPGEVEEIQPLFINIIDSPLRPLPAQAKPVNQLSSVGGMISNEGWYKQNSGKTELLRDFFDPNKNRTTAGVLITEDKIEDLAQESYSIDFNQKRQAGVWGQKSLAFNKYSNTSLTNLNDKSTPVNQDLAQILFQSTIFNMTTNLLSPGGRIIYNDKDYISYWMDVSGTIVSLGTAAIGAGVGAAGGIAGGSVKAGLGGGFFGFLGGNMISILTNKIFNWVPKSVFERVNSVWKGTSTNLLLPTPFLKAWAIKISFLKEALGSTTANEKRIPLELFFEGGQNYLSGLINTQIYPMSIVGEITHEVNNKDTKSMLEKKNGVLFTKNTAPTLNSVEDGYVIDLVSIKALTKANCRVSFFNKDKELIWENTQKTQGGQTGNLFDWETMMVLNNYQDNFKSADQRYLGPAYEDKKTGFGFSSDVSFFNNVKTYDLEDAPATFFDSKNPTPQNSDLTSRSIFIDDSYIRVDVVVYKDKAQTSFNLNNITKELVLHEQDKKRVEKHGSNSVPAIKQIWDHYDNNRPWKLRFNAELLIQLHMLIYKSISGNHRYKNELDYVVKQWNRTYVVSEGVETELFSSLVTGWNKNDCFWVSFYSQKPMVLSWSYKEGKIDIKINQSTVLIWWLKDNDGCMVSDKGGATKIDLNLTNISLIR